MPYKLIRSTVNIVQIIISGSS